MSLSFASSGLDDEIISIKTIKIDFSSRKILVKLRRYKPNLNTQLSKYAPDIKLEFIERFNMRKERTRLPGIYLTYFAKTDNFEQILGHIL